MKRDILIELFDIIESRKTSTAQDSYVKSLMEDGIVKINEKVLEEALELLEATTEKDQGKKEKLIHETADLWFHVMVLLSYQDIHISEILHELKSRLGISGHTEKSFRNK